MNHHANKYGFRPADAVTYDTIFCSFCDDLAVDECRLVTAVTPGNKMFTNTFNGITICLAKMCEKHRHELAGKGYCPNHGPKRLTRHLSGQPAK